MSHLLYLPKYIRDYEKAHEFRIIRIPKLYDPLSFQSGFPFLCFTVPITSGSDFPFKLLSFFMPKRGDPKVYAISFGFNWSFLGDDPLRVFFLKGEPVVVRYFGPLKYITKTHVTNLRRYSPGCVGPNHDSKLLSLFSSSNCQTEFRRRPEESQGRSSTLMCMRILVGYGGMWCSFDGLKVDGISDTSQKSCFYFLFLKHSILYCNLPFRRFGFGDRETPKNPIKVYIYHIEPIKIEVLHPEWLGSSFFKMKVLNILFLGFPEITSTTLYIHCVFIVVHIFICNIHVLKRKSSLYL